MEVATLTVLEIASNADDNNFLLASVHGVKIFDFNSKPSTEIELKPKPKLLFSEISASALPLFIQASEPVVVYPVQRIAKGASAVLVGGGNSYDLPYENWNELLEGLSEKTSLLQEAAEHIEEAVSIFSGSSSSAITSNSYSHLSHELTQTITDAAETRRLVKEACSVIHNFYSFTERINDEVPSSVSDNRESLDRPDSWANSFVMRHPDRDWGFLLQEIVDTLGRALARLVYYQTLFISLSLCFKSAHCSSNITDGVEGCIPYLTWPRPPTLAFKN